MAGPLQLTFALTRREYVAAAGAGANRVLRAATVVGVGLFAAGLAARIELLTGLGIMASIVGAAALTVPFWRWSTSPALHAEEHWTVDETGCQIERADSTTRSSWAFYRELLDAGSVFVLLDQRGHAEVIPKRAFPSEADETAFVDLSRAHVVVRDTSQAASTGWTD